MKRLENRVALVTGGSRGIGAAIVERLAEEGAHVAINYTSPGSESIAEQLKEKVKADFGVRAMIVKANVGLKKEVDHMIEEVESELGEVEILVNNAGIAPFEPFMKTTEETWDRTYNTNV